MYANIYLCMGSKLLSELARHLRPVGCFFHPWVPLNARSIQGGAHVSTYVYECGCASTVYICAYAHVYIVYIYTYLLHILAVCPRARNPSCVPGHNGSREAISDTTTLFLDLHGYMYRILICTYLLRVSTYLCVFCTARVCGSAASTWE